MTDIVARTADLREILRTRQREIQNDVRGRIRDGLTDRPNEVGDDIEQFYADIQGDIDVALLLMTA
jgi:hypothetical protein